MSLERTIHDIFGCDLLRASPVSGGDINDAFCLILSDNTKVFMKSNRSVDSSFFRAEADGLTAIAGTAAIRVPGVIAGGEDVRRGAFLLLEWVEAAPQARDYWEDFGHALALMHQAEAPGRFGWSRDNFIGASVQKNTYHGSWISFYRECRLLPQFRRAERYFDASTRKRIQKLLDHLEDHLVEPERASLLHGDLWSGNFITGNDGHAWLIDPAVYIGHAEADLAMTELFGGFHSRFYAAYREAASLQPGYTERRDLYNLYHLLNHLNLFGSGYLASVERCVKRYS